MFNFEYNLAIWYKLVKLQRVSVSTKGTFNPTFVIVILNVI